MPKWIDAIVASTAEAESPERFQYWSAMCAISATVKKNVVLDRFYYKLYPNIYVFLVAKSGLRKGNPVTFAKKIVTEAKTTRVILGRNSIQAALKELGKPYPLGDGSGVLREASAFFVSGELASFLVKDPEALTILTDLYDTHANEPEWKNTLKTSGTDILKQPCLTLLGATNEEHFRDAVPLTAVGGGFIARTLIVMEHKRRVVNDLMDAPKIKPPSVEKSAEFLLELSKLKGEFKLAAKSRTAYKEWYKWLCEMEHDDRTGTIERLGDTVLKVAMLVSLGDEKTDLVVRSEHMEEAIKRCMECLAGLKELTMGAGKSESADPTRIVMKELLAKPDNMMKKRSILSKYWGEMDTIQLDRVIETLVQAGAVETHLFDRDGKGKEAWIVMKQEAVEMYKRYKTEIN